MTTTDFDLAASAHAEMSKAGFHPDFPAGSDAQVASIRAAVAAAAAHPDPKARDLRGPWWSSIDNDTSKDLDQIEMAERLDGGIRVRVAIANVAAAIAKGSPLDLHAAQQTLTVYTAVRIFPMLPNDLSTDLTSLNQDVDRAALVTEYVVDTQGNLSGQSVYRARCGTWRNWPTAELVRGWRAQGRRTRRLRRRLSCRRNCGCRMRRRRRCTRAGQQMARWSSVRARRTRW